MCGAASPIEAGNEYCTWDANMKVSALQESTRPGMRLTGWLPLGAHLLLEGRHARDEQQRRELDSALHVEVRLRKRLQELPEGGREEGVVLVLGHLYQHTQYAQQEPGAS
jgi:hypothetical protein